ncbi:MAG: outer membrane protein assembly factor BamA [Chlamydiales bacterium]|nr:outer membrane protein assembly factor BamA [Chlamydiales bacterium]
MAKLHSFFFTLLLVLLPFSLVAEQLENKVVERIDVIFVDEPTDTEYNSKYVLTKIRTRASDIFSQSDFDSDLKDLASDYDHVEPSIEVIDTNIYITLTIWPKPLVRSICWQGNCKIATKCLRDELGVRSGCLFDRVDFNRSFQKVKAYYIKQGFFEADVEYSVVKDPECNEVDITICINEGRSGKIKKIALCGFTRCEEEAIFDMMYTKEYNWFMSWFSPDGVYNEEAIQVDQFRILNYLHDLGYADAEVDIDVCEADQSERIIINIRANKGDLYRIESISFEGNCIFEDDAIQSMFCVTEGGVYSPDMIRQTVRRITDLYGRYGYVDAVVDYEARIMEGDCGYSLNFVIEEGEQFRVGLIKVYGNHCTDSRVILHESLMIPGEVFNIDRLKKSEERLINVGYFKCVNVYIAGVNDQLGCDCNYRDVHIEVEEQGTGNFGAFAGYSTTEQLFCGINITEKNFDHRGLTRWWKDGLCTLRGGGEFVYLTTNIGQKARSYSMSWTQPYFNDTPWSVGVDIEKSWVGYVSNDYEIDAIGGSLHASYPLDQFTRFGWHYRIRNTTVNVDNGSRNNETLVDEARNSGLISATGVSLNYDSTDSPSCPTNGFRSRLELEYAGLGGESQFWGLAYLNTFYMPVCKKGVLKFRADCRFIMPAGHTSKDEIPIDERLFLGGDNQVRGYRPYAIGPKFPGSNDPRGGISLTLFSAEYNHKFWDRLDGFLFVDGGELSRARLFFGDINWSAGYGARLKVFENGPPLCVGMGYPLNAKSKSDEKRFFWTIGGRF